MRKVNNLIYITNHLERFRIKSNKKKNVTLEVSKEIIKGKNRIIRNTDKFRVRKISRKKY